MIHYRNSSLSLFLLCLIDNFSIHDGHICFTAYGGQRICSPNDYISILSRKKFGPGTRITTHCSFEDDGAPLIVLAESMSPDGRGVLRYGNYFEVVLYKNGMSLGSIVAPESKARIEEFLKEHL